MTEELRKTGVQEGTTEYRLLRKDGTCVYAEAKRTVMYRSGQPFAIQGIARDITERKQTETALREGDRQLRLQIENSRDMISRHKPDGTVVFVSPASETLLGYSSSDLVGHGAGDFVHPDDIEGVWDIIQAAVEGKQSSYRVEHRMRRKSGEYIWIETIGRLLYTSDGELAEIQCSVRDITERKRAENLLRIQRDIGIALSSVSQITTMLKRLLEHLLQIEEIDCGGVYLVDEETGALDLVAHKGLPRQFIEHATHYEADTPQTHIVMAGTPIYRSYTEILPGAKDKVRQQEGLQVLAVIPVIFEGQVIAALNLASHTYNEIPGAICTALETMATTHIGEVLARVKVETALQTLNEELEQRVVRRTAELEAANKELREFAYVVSHDLKAPLRGISRLAQWLMADYVDLFNEKGRDMVNLLVGRVKRMDSLIEGILQYSRVGRLVGRDERIDLNTLVKDVIDSLAPPEHIHISIENDLPEIVGNKIRIVQVLQNLLTNAIEFMNKSDGKIVIGCVDDGSYWRFNITDNGPGIDEKYFTRIFKIFQTLVPRDEHESTGIGLALVKKIVELHGGKIWVESVVGEGSKFFFTLPKT
jgi:PAS domain S-box-containing protein